VNYQKLIVVGNAAADPRRQKSKKSKLAYTLFRVAVNDGKDKTVFFSVAAFDKLGQNVARYVSKGREVLVEGRVTVSEAGRYGVVADRVVFGAGSAQQPKATAEEEDELEELLSA
jgi:hypothetical protein